MFVIEEGIGGAVAGSGGATVGKGGALVGKECVSSDTSTFE